MGEWRLMSHGRTQLCPREGQCQRLAQGPGHRSSHSLGTVAPGLGCCRGPGGGPTTLPARLCCGVFTLAKGRDCSSAVSPCCLWAMLRWCSQFVLQLRRRSGHLVTSVTKIVAADGTGLEMQAGTLEEGIWRNLSSLPCIKWIFENLTQLVTGMTTKQVCPTGDFPT